MPSEHDNQSDFQVFPGAIYSGVLSATYMRACMHILGFQYNLQSVIIRFYFTPKLITDCLHVSRQISAWAL